MLNLLRKTKHKSVLILNNLICKMISYEEIYKKLCRLCLSCEDKEQLVRLTDVNSEDGLSCYGKAVTTFACISIKVTDRLPCSMCSKCLQSLKQAIRFKLQCESSDKRLLNWSDILKNKETKTEEVIVQNIMFCKYFPDESSTIQGFNKCLTQSSVVTNDLPENIEVMSQDSNEENQQCLSDVDSSDELLDRMETIIGKCGKRDGESLDDLMVHMEKNIDQYSNVDNVNFTKCTQNNKTKNNGVESKGGNEENQQCLSDIDSSDELLLDRMEAIIGQYRKKDGNSLDDLLVHMEKNIDQYSNIDNVNLTKFTQQSKKTISKIHTKKFMKLETTLAHKNKKMKSLKYINSPQSSAKKRFICKICNKKLANKGTYKYHMQRHTGCSFICEQCGKGFPLVGELQLHQVARHGTGPHLPCKHCNFKAARKHILVEHERLHTGERPYTCDKCGLTFRRRAIWRKHMVYHTEKTVQCLQCPRKFFRRSEMEAHANSMHERMHVYSCHKCDATYAKTASVRRHLTERHGIPREMQGKIIRINTSRGTGNLNSD